MVCRTQLAHLATEGKASLEKRPTDIWLLVKVLLDFGVSKRRLWQSV